MRPGGPLSTLVLALGCVGREPDTANKLEVRSRAMIGTEHFSEIEYDDRLCVEKIQVSHLTNCEVDDSTVVQVDELRIFCMAGQDVRDFIRLVDKQ